jgi:hypothetical protein
MGNWFTPPLDRSTPFDPHVATIITFDLRTTTVLLHDKIRGCFPSLDLFHVGIKVVHYILSLHNSLIRQ